MRAPAYVSDVLKTLGFFSSSRVPPPPASRSIFDHKSYGAFTVRFSYTRTRVHAALLKRPFDRVANHSWGEVMGRKTMSFGRRHNGRFFFFFLISPYPIYARRLSTSTVSVEYFREPNKNGRGDD